MSCQGLSSLNTKMACRATHASARPSRNKRCSQASRALTLDTAWQASYSASLPDFEAMTRNQFQEVLEKAVAGGFRVKLQRAHLARRGHPGCTGKEGKKRRGCVSTPPECLSSQMMSAPTVASRPPLKLSATQCFRFLPGTLLL